MDEQKGIEQGDACHHAGAPIDIPATDLSAVSVENLKGVGARTSMHLARLNINSLQDLLFHLPLRYEDRTRVYTIGNLKPGMHVLVEGMVLRTAIVGNKKAQLVCRIQDDTGCLTLKFFHFNAQQRERLSKEGTWIRCFGEVRQGYSGGLEMVHPDYRHATEASELPLADHLTPVYPTTQGLTQPTLRKLVDQALVYLNQEDALVELLPESVLASYQLMTLREALHAVHHPSPGSSQEKLQSGAHPAQQRLAFEELLAHQLSLQQLRQAVRGEASYAIETLGLLRQKLLHALTFSLTGAQSRVVDEILKDLRGVHPMLRLVQGDVGSGKTIVAALAALDVVEMGFQVAVMAPTEILAEQHLQKFSAWFAPLGVRVGKCVSGMPTSVREPTLAAIVAGELQVVVGTHALFQEAVQFKRLGLMIVDEQHRFGVHQRLALIEKGRSGDRFPHQLVMSATPIPRTLAMTAYADLDCSMIDEMPSGRKPIQTVLIPQKRRAEIIERVRQSCAAGCQAYWICTLIETSEALQCEAAEDTAALLAEKLPNCRIGLVHGKLKSEEKESVMQAFKAGALDLLVATTVVEVGVDVPNASLMVIENPERLGLAQLHQLRGRVGRGEAQSYCVLLYRGPLSMMAQQRLSILRSTHDGFEVAKQDLALRGPGEVFGTRQAGLMQLKIADLIRDKELLPQVQSAGTILMNAHPSHVQHLIQRWMNGAEKFASV